MTIRNISSKMVLSPKQIKESDLKTIGGKAKQLFTLTELGFNVPQWLVLPYTKITQYEKDVTDFDSQIILDEIKNHFSEQTRFAVRSSASLEDGINHSFAGQFHTELNVKLNDIPKAIKKVLNSVESKHIHSYLKEGEIKEKISMAVIIQEMIDVDVSGVAFGMNPVSGNRNEKVISSVYGLGEGLVSGEINADNYLINEAIEKKIEKKQLARRGTNKGTALVEVPPNLQNLSSLSEKQLHKISSSLDKLKEFFGKYQDIEFGFKDKQFYIFQTRPITGINRITDKMGEKVIWDNSNIVESYPGVTSPLTFSFILKTYSGAYKQISKLFGVSEKVLREKNEVYNNLLGLLKGRVYYNLKNWYIILAQLPGFKLNAKFMEGMMGVKESFELEEENKMGKIEAWYRVIISIFKMLWQLISLPSNSIKFHKLIDKTEQEQISMNISHKRSFDLMTAYLKLENILLKEWKAPLVNDLYAMIFFGLLQKLSKKYFPENPSIGNILIAESGDIISTQPAKRLLKIAEMISKNEEAKSLFLKNTPQAILNQLPQYKLINLEINEYINLFGDRCTGELKLETITYKQDPKLLIHIIKTYVEKNINANEKTSELKDSAEAFVAKKLKGKLFKKIIFKYTLKKARQLVSGRENLRFERTRAFAMVRNIFIAIGKNWYTEGIISDERDIFLLSQEEIFSYIKGTSINENLKQLIKLRKESDKRFKESEAPTERINTYGAVYHTNDFYKTSTKRIVHGDIKGIACCPGVVKGKVQIIKDPSEINSLGGDILVTTSTDPGWVALFPTASAILVERGSLLSHSAIVAREMSIPCIVGISDLLKRLKTGDIVEMDGSTGEVKIIN